jgi:hypothetical protein
MIMWVYPVITMSVLEEYSTVRKVTRPRGGATYSWTAHISHVRMPMTSHLTFHYIRLYRIGTGRQA